MGHPALTEFQEKLTADIFTNMPGSALTTDLAKALDKAVKAATKNFIVDLDTDHVKDAHGHIHNFGPDGHPLEEIHGPEDEARLLVRVTARTVYFRDETAAEADKRARRLAAAAWRLSDRSTPPPSSVGTLTLLEQSRWWVPKDKDPIQVNKIDPRWRVNLIHWLERQATKLKLRAEWDFAALISGPLGPGGDMAIDAADSEYNALLDMSPLDWLHAQPLMLELRRLAKNYEKTQRRKARRRSAQ